MNHFAIQQKLYNTVNQLYFYKINFNKKKKYTFLNDQVMFFYSTGLSISIFHNKMSDLNNMFPNTNDHLQYHLESALAKTLISLSVTLNCKPIFPSD